MMKLLKEFARFAVGGLFIFSGLIKLNDPTGTAIKLQEYFEVFAQDFTPFFENLVPAAMFFSIFLSVLEVVLGIALFIAHRMKLTSLLLVVIIIFFTALTFYSAYTGKVTDCGCFGDAIKLTPWESFYKDVVLLVLIFVIAFNFHTFKPVFSLRVQNVLMIGSTLVFTFLALWAIWYLPFIDFRHYAVGNDLTELMKPEEPAVYEYILEKDGEQFSFETYPTEPGYTFVEMKVLNEEKATPKITDFAVWDDEDDYTDDVLSGIKMIYVFHDVNKANLKALDDMKELEKATNLDTWVLTSSNYQDYENFRHEYQVALPFYYADATVLKAVVRSNPGMILLKDAVVLGKWHYNSVPEADDILELVN